MLMQPQPRGVQGRIHVGHARTMILGEMICKDLGIPYHLLFEAAWNQVAVTHEGLIDTFACLMFLGVRPAMLYARPLDPSPDDVLRARVPQANWDAMKEVQRQFESFETDRWSSVAEDLEWYPSLRIRGAEFEQPAVYLGPDIFAQRASKAISEILAYEKALYKAGGLEWGQATLPLIVEHGGAKMSKSVRGAAWDCLRSVSSEDARAYLLATVANPLDPLAAIGQTVDVLELDPTPHVWSWETWGAFIRSIAGQ